MKRIAMLSALAAASLLATGCASYCERAEEVGQSMKDKVKNCGTVSVSSTTVDSCEAKTKECTDEDFEKMEANLDCMDDLPDCESGKEMEYLGKMVDCAKKLEGVSAACGKE